MASKNNEYDYEEILKELVKKGVIDKKLDEARNTVFSKFLGTLKNSYVEKNKHDVVEVTSNQNHLTFSNHIKLNNSVCHELNCLNEKLTNSLVLQQELERKKQEIVSEFCRTMEFVYNHLQKLQQEFDYDTMKESINECLKNKRFCEDTAPMLQKEIENMNKLLNNIETCEIPDIEIITKLIQNESLKHMGDPLKIQNCLSAIRQKNRLLVEKYIM